MSTTAELLDGGLEEHRAALTGYCYRMLGSVFEAEDAVQETMLRAWRGLDRYEGRAALRPWLYRIATNVCLDLLRGRARRAMPVDLGRGLAAGERRRRRCPARGWVAARPRRPGAARDGDPAEQVAAAGTPIRLAFVAALQHLPPRQRAVLILRDVLGGGPPRWPRCSTRRWCRSTARCSGPGPPWPSGDRRCHRAARAVDIARTGYCVDRYVDAFERFDIESLVALLHEDATLSMPPHPLWLEGREQVRRWWCEHRAVCAGSRLVPVAANGSPAVAQFRPDGAGSVEAFALQVLDVSDGRIRGVTAFLEPRLFPLFSPLPSTPRDGRRPHLRTA